LSYSDDQGLVSAALVLDKDYLLDIDERHLMMRTRNANTFIGRLFCANFVSTLVALFAGSLGTCSATSYEDDASKSQLIVPGHTAYILPDPWGLRVRENAGVQWSSASQSIQWTGLFRQAGILKIQVVAECTKEQAARLELEVLGKSLQLVSDNTLGEPSGSNKRVLDFGQVELEHASPAYISLTLKLRDSQGQDAGLISKSQPIQVVELRLDGPGAKEAHFNLKEWDRAGSKSRRVLYRSPSRRRARWDLLHGLRLASWILWDASEFKDRAKDYLQCVG